jgi:hypothetical protein
LDELLALLVVLVTGTCLLEVCWLLLCVEEVIASSSVTVVKRILLRPSRGLGEDGRQVAAHLFAQGVLVYENISWYQSLEAYLLSRSLFLPRPPCGWPRTPHLLPPKGYN